MTLPDTLALGHGTGNDFVLFFDSDGAWDPNPAQVSVLCDRRRGLGGDGLIRCVLARHLIDQLPGAQGTEWAMDYRNADGSVAEMCGNGVRVCVAYLLHRQAITEDDLSGDGLAIATRGGVKHVWRDPGSGDLTVSMGAAGFDSLEFQGFMSAQQLTASTNPANSQPTIEVSDCQKTSSRSGYYVDMGNPHVVAMAEHGASGGLAASELDLSQLPVINGQPHAGVNVEFVDLPEVPESVATTASHEPVDLVMRVYERGVGETLSCGTGAVAAGVVASCCTGRNGLWRVHVPGGQVAVKVSDFGQSTTLGGAAVIVADVTLTPSWAAELLALGTP